MSAFQSRYVKEMRLESEEESLGVGLVDPVEATWFRQSDTPYALYPRYYSSIVYCAIYFDLSADYTIHKRSIYTALDLLGDVGGLLDGLRLLGGILISVYTLATFTVLLTSGERKSYYCIVHYLGEYSLEGT